MENTSQSVRHDFVNFEIKAHDMIKDGKTYDEISEEYLNDLKSQYKIKIDDNFKYEWMYVNHIFDRPFYVYAYAFGKLLTLALYELYLENKDKFKPKIIKLLSEGGSKSPIEITKEIGIDITDEKFWQKGFDFLNEYLKELENN